MSGVKMVSVKMFVIIVFYRHFYPLSSLIYLSLISDTWDNIQNLSSAMIILAAFEDWEWTTENLLTKYIIPNLNKYGSETLNEKAFDLFCNLYGK